MSYYILTVGMKSLISSLYIYYVQGGIILSGQVAK